MASAKKSMNTIDQHYEPVKGLIRNKKRVKELAEVFTRPREVNLMLDLLGDVAYEPEATFLEPACGNGNFLTEILARKARGLDLREEGEFGYSYELLAALATITAIDISAENVKEAINRLWSHAFGWHVYLTGKEPSQGWALRALGVLSLKIITGNFLDGDTEVNKVTVVPCGQIIAKPHPLSSLMRKGEPSENKAQKRTRKKKATPAALPNRKPLRCPTRKPGKNPTMQRPIRSDTSPRETLL